MTTSYDLPTALDISAQIHLGTFDDGLDKIAAATESRKIAIGLSFRKGGQAIITNEHVTPKRVLGRHVLITKVNRTTVSCRLIGQADSRFVGEFKCPMSLLTPVAPGDEIAVN